jgi:TPR repeat protein
MAGDLASDPRTPRRQGRCVRVGCWLLLWAAFSAAQSAPQDDYLRGELAYHRGDVVGAMSALRPAAQVGHAPSQALLAFILDRADFVDEAARLYRDAAAQDNADGHAGLANAYLSGRGVAKDEKQAAAHFSKAADGGHAAAIDLVAVGWIKGQMGLQASADPSAAQAALLRAADRGHLPSVVALAGAYQQGGYGLAADAAEAARWQTRAAELRRQRAPKPAPKASR